MIYTIKRANLLADQFRNFKTSHIHHLAGLCANLEFWINEVEEAFKALDGYHERFLLLRAAQREWVERYDIKEYQFCRICGGRCEFDNGPVAPAPPRRTPSSELENARVELKDEAREFLMRCYQAGMLDEDSLREKCARIGTGVEYSELKY